MQDFKIQLTPQVFALIPQAHRRAFLTGAECILHAVSLMSDSEAYKWQWNQRSCLYETNGMFVTPPFVEDLLSHFVQTREILFPSLTLWPVDQQVGSPLANK